MVRYLVVALALGLSVPTVASSSSNSAVNVKKGELLLEVTASGVSVQKAVKISSYCDLKIYANSNDDAKRELDSKKAEMESRAIGSISFDFGAAPKITEIGNIDYAIAAAADAAAEGAAAEAAAAIGALEGESVNKAVTENYRYDQTVTMSARNAADFLAARDIAKELGCGENYKAARNPLMEIADPDAAKKLAMNDAIGRAKTQAMEYADVLDMKVIAMLRVSEVGGLREFLGAELSGMLIAEMKRDQARRRGGVAALTDDVHVTHSVSIDFILAPK